MGGLVKASFHRDRNCHVGFTSEYIDTARERFPNVRSRHWERWTLPDKPLVRAVQVVIPTSELRAFRSKEEPQTKWIPVPPDNSLSVVSVFIAKPGIDAQWPGSKYGAQPLGLMLTAHHMTWAVYTHNPVNGETARWIEEHRTKLTALPVDAETTRWIEERRAKAALMPRASEAPHELSARAVLWGSRGNQGHYFFELAWGHLPTN
jgi:hypothetical protein